MVVRSKKIDYQHEHAVLKGYMSWDDRFDGPRPGVLICHDAMGSNTEFLYGRAQALAALGYVGFAIDVYGDGANTTTTEQATVLMEPFKEDTDFLRKRLLAAVNAAAAQNEIDAENLAAIGYCFGGKCVLELARCGAPVEGVASFHGVLAVSEVPTVDPVGAKILVLHGWDDPFVPVEDVLAFTEEMNKANADWQLVAYSNTLHSFTKPGRFEPEKGIAYNPLSEQRSWKKLENFLTELFPGT